MNRTNFDWASGWPLRPEAIEAMADARPIAGGDPARAYVEGRAARDLLESSTATVANRLGAATVTWNSGGTEAIHLAVLGAVRAAVRAGDPRRNLVVSAVEHSAVLRAANLAAELFGVRVDTVPVDTAGAVDPDDVAARVDEDTLLVNVQHANHEVGTLQHTHAIAVECRDAGALLHVDACQTVGQLGVTLAQLGADLVTASAHKFGGPTGVGLLAAGERARVAPLLEGDDRQGARRAGRLDVPSIAGAAVALEVGARTMEADRSRREVVRRTLREQLPQRIEDVQVHGRLAESHPGIVSFSCLYVHGSALVDELDRAGFAVHSGSSCARDSNVPSHVLEAMGALTHGHVRASVGPDASPEDAERFVDVLAEVVPRLRALTRRRP
ncbi:MAG: aminotransferase class V-fold PLP-dependent enzyme [Nitriliruptorales bacterium]|nr:aminotransferase class V-fold PLP-dependent enzyme [Nitriliruptorales bacterium]